MRTRISSCLITCAVSRRVHLGLVPNLTTEAFVRCLRRFVSRKGVPSLVILDNAKTFKSTHLTSFLTSSGTQWQYNVEKALWWGGFFETLVKFVKRCLRKTLGNGRLTYQELLTTLIEVEGVLNSRPLTYVYDDDPGKTPHLFMDRRVLSQRSSEKINGILDASVTSADLVKRANHLKHVLQHFWSRWSKDYITELREHHRVTKRRMNSPQIQGDVICVHDEKLPRNLWRLGKIQKLIRGKR